MQILIYKGSSQYGAFDYFTASLKSALEARSHSVEIFDLNMPNAMNKLLEIFTNKVFDCVIGFNGLGCDFKAGDESVYNIVKTHFLGIFVDHPVHHIDRLASPMHYFLASFLDKGHVDFLQNSMSESQVLKFFMPLSGEEFGKSIENYEEYKSVKDIDILFTGSNFGTATKKWESIDSIPNYLFEEISQKLIKDEYISVDEAYTQVMNGYKIAFSSIAKAQMASFLSMVVSYVREYKRNVILKKLFQSGLKITVYGKNWAEIVSEYSNVTNGGEVTLEKTIELTKKAKVVINLNTNFTQGGHDRVFTGMLNHAVVFTDRSTYYDEYFTDEVDYLTYSLNTLESDIEKLRVNLKDNKKLFDMANNAYNITKVNHTWDNRAKYLEEIVSFAKKINS